ncbi:metallophosphoesterase [Candidatus Woesearchaeota archaeon]|nr:metallophosphoesterase [Candidatus Woesearchaeota archaeon]
METIYGIISDCHKNSGMVAWALRALERKGAQAYLVNGDMAEGHGKIPDAQDRLAYILDMLGETGKPIYISPGSHEPLGVFAPAVAFSQHLYPNLISTVDHPFFSVGTHDLVFLPGSDFVSGGEYLLARDPDLPTGKYLAIDKKLQPLPYLNTAAALIRAGKAQAQFAHTNPYDLYDLVTSPEKTIVICHVPRKFDNLDEAVDMAEFGEVTEQFKIDDQRVERGSIIPLDHAQRLVKRGAPIQIKKENRGNEPLAGIYEDMGITKAVSGHFHESAHRANDRNGKHVAEGTWTNELFWMASYLDGAKAGLLFVRDDGQIKYENVDLS